MGRKESRTAFGSVEEYYAWLKEEEDKYLNNGNKGISVGAQWYEANLNLRDEIADLPDGTVVCDAGCADGRGIVGLQIALPRLQFIGVTPFIHTTPNSVFLNIFTPKKVPIYQGKIEELPDALKRNGLQNPSVITARNVMWLITLAETSANGELAGFTGKSLLGLHDSLDSGGKALIYDEHLDMDFYAIYLRLIRESGLRFEPHLLPNHGGRCRSYLRLDRY